MQYVASAARAFSQAYENEFTNVLDRLAGLGKDDTTARDDACLQGKSILYEWQSAMTSLQETFQSALEVEQPTGARIRFLLAELEHVCQTGRRHYWQRGAA
jgi:hypothetical protein